MKRCIKIIVRGDFESQKYLAHAQEAAHSCSVEGTGKRQEDAAILIYAAGESGKLDEFLDHLYQGPKGALVEEIALELAPYRDFRGVFRVVGEGL